MPQVYLDVPDVRQSTSFSCGAAAVQAVLGYYGVDHREEELAKALTSKGTHEAVPPGAIVRVLLGAGLSVYAGRMTLPQLKRFLVLRVPIILPIQAWPEKNIPYAENYEDGHWVVAVGYSDGAILFEDPSLLGVKGWLKESELELRWHDQDTRGHIVDHFGIAAFGRTPTFDSNKVQHISATKRVAFRWLSEGCDARDI